VSKIQQENIMRTARLPASDKDPYKCDVGEGPLIFDLMGPFVVQFQQSTQGMDSGTAIICAPLCVDHHANILTDRNDISLAGNPAPPPEGGFCRGYVYTLTGPKGLSQFKSEPDAHKQILRVNYADRNYEGDDGLRIDPDKIGPKCHLVVKAPMPDRIVPLRPEAIWIHRNSPPKESGLPENIWVMQEDSTDIVSADRGISTGRARGLRFYYQSSQFPTLGLQDPESVNDPPLRDLCAVTRFPDGATPAPYYNMTLRFAATHASAEDGLQDAYDCFQEMRKLFDVDEKGTIPSDFSKWRVDFSDPCPTSNNKFSLTKIVGGRPHDCGAATMALQDWDDTK
jgi:hypothetical protein